MSLSQLQEISPRNLVLLVGPPGSGKSTFCQQAALKNLTMGRPTIFVTTEYSPSEAKKALRERGLLEVKPGLLNFVDAYHETVGISVSDRPDTISADCGNLTSLGIAISKMQKRIAKTNILLVFDSLTSPYLLRGPVVVRFLRLNLLKFVAEGNSVLACFDEGSGKNEDLVAMMSFSNGVIKIEVEEDKRVLNVVKHPQVMRTRIEVPITPSIGLEARIHDSIALKQFILAAIKGDEKELHSSSLTIQEAQSLLAHDNLQNLTLFNELVQQEKSKFSQLVVKALEEYVRRHHPQLSLTK